MSRARPTQQDDAPTSASGTQPPGLSFRKPLRPSARWWWTIALATLGVGFAGYAAVGAWLRERIPAAPATIDELYAEADPLVARTTERWDRVREDLAAGRIGLSAAARALDQECVAPLAAVGKKLEPVATDSPFDAHRRALIHNRVQAEVTRMEAELLTMTLEEEQGRQRRKMEKFRVRVRDAQREVDALENPPTTAETPMR